LPPAEAGAARFPALTRQDGFIQNRIHWRRDVTMQEDACQGRARPTAQVFESLNTAILTLLDRQGKAPSQQNARLSDQPHACPGSLALET